MTAVFSQAGGSRCCCMSEGEFLEGEGAALFEDGDEAAEMGRGHVGLQRWLVLPCFDDFDVVVGGEACECLVGHASGIVEREFDEFDGGVDGFLAERAVGDFKKTVQSYHNLLMLYGYTHFMINVFHSAFVVLWL